jgi:hypothetical protein
MQGLMHLLEQALAQSQWRESFAAPVALDDSGLAEEDRPQRPRYLN